MFEKNIKKYAIPLLCIVVYVIVFLSGRLYSGDIDSYQISNVLNGTYDAENYCVFVHPLLSGIVSLLQKLYAQADWYIFIQRLLSLVALGSVLFDISATLKERKACAVLTILLTVVSVRAGFTKENFTIASAFYSVSGMLLLSDYIERKLNSQGLVMGLLLVAAGFVWRFESFLLVLPFFLLHVAAFLFEKLQLRELKKYKAPLLKVIIPVAILVLVLGMSDLIVKSLPEYRQAVEYNNARSTIVDYPISDYEDIKDELTAAGISENDYAAASGFLLADTDVTNSQWLETLASIASGEKKHTVKKSVQEMYELFSSYKKEALIVFLIAVLGFLHAGSLLQRIELVLSTLGFALILFVFAYIGRLIPRVMFATLVGYSYTLLCCLKIPSEKSIVTVLAPIIVIALFSVWFFKMQECAFQSPFKAKSGFNDEAFEEIKSDSNTYLFAVSDYDRLVMKQCRTQGKLYPESITSKMLPDGDWIYGQNYFNNYLERNGFSNPMKSLLYDDNWRYIGNENRCNIVLTWLREHYDENAYVEQTGTFSGVPIWKFEIAGN